MSTDGAFEGSQEVRDISSEGLEILHRTQGGFEFVSPCGEIDLATQGMLRSSLNDLIVAGRVNIVVDLAETTFLDSTGLGALIGARRRTHGLNGSFAIICPNPRMRKMFQLSRLELVFRLYESREQWLEAHQD